MTGIITAVEINERREPSQESRAVGYYREGAIVDIDSIVTGTDYDSDDTWYRLKNGNYLWSGGVSIERDCSGLPLTERQQFLVCYRQKRDSRPLLDSFVPADTIYPALLTLPATICDVNLDLLDWNGFIADLISKTRNLNTDRKDVFIYIHGYQLISSLKLDLFSSFVQSYFTHSSNKIAKAIFFAWPSQGGPARKTVDDRSIKAGQDFTEKKLFDMLYLLSTRLGEAGLRLNLIVHSFGHQLLNGMLNPINSNSFPSFSHKLFEKVFLMAPDISHLVFQKGGAKLENYFGDTNLVYEYDYSRLLTLANQVHVFYDEDDFLLYVSTRKFVGKDRAADAAQRIQVDKYRGLGNYGDKAIPGEAVLPGFNFHSIQELISNAEPADRYDYPFQPLKSKIAGMVKDLRKNGDYSKVTGLRVLFNSGRFTDRHRYVFTCKPVVDKIQSLL